MHPPSVSTDNEIVFRRRLCCCLETDLFDACSRRAAAQPVVEFPECCIVAMDEAFHAAVVAIAYPAAEPQCACHVATGSTKIDALNASGYYEVA